MSRKPREEEPYAPYHLTIRGNNKEPIFINDECYIRYMGILQGYQKICGFRIYCYCLMPNHVHLLLESSELAPISKIMQRINTRYTIYFNNKFNRTGHVLEGRYKSKIIDSDEYFLQVSLYIHLNPVKAGLCRLPEEYIYSSASNYAGLVRKEFVETAHLLSMISPNQEDAIKRYKVLLSEEQAMALNVVPVQKNEVNITCV